MRAAEARIVEGQHIGQQARLEVAQDALYEVLPVQLGRHAAARENVQACHSRLHRQEGRRAVLRVCLWARCHGLSKLGSNMYIPSGRATTSLEASEHGQIWLVCHGDIIRQCGLHAGAGHYLIVRADESGSALLHVWFQYLQEPQELLQRNQLHGTCQHTQPV